MKLGLSVGYAGARASIDMDFIKHAESLGYDSVWTAEAYGSDAVTTATWMLAQTTKIKVGTAIMQMPARTPSCAAMTAMTLDHLSGGRFRLGIGPSGPQVVEGWHGESYEKPLTRLREYIEVLRQIFRREAPLEHQGFHYQIPNNGPGTTGLGKPLKSILHGDPTLPIYVAAMREKAVETTAELADGLFPVWMNPERFDLLAPHLEAGFARAPGDKSLKDFDVAPAVSVVVGDDVDKCRAAIKGGLALYIGGMGARGKNFYNDYAKQLGYEAAAVQIQDLYLDGKKKEAMAAVPDALVDETALVGPPERIKERLEVWKEAGKRGEVGTLKVSSGQREALEVVAEALL